MPITESFTNTNKEFLRERLKKHTSLSLKTWFPSLLLLCSIPLCLGIYYDAKPQPGQFRALFCVVLLSQAFLLLRVAILRKLQPEKTDRAGRLCFWFNIFSILCWPLLMVPIVLTSILAFFGLFLIWICFILDFMATNRLILACRKPQTSPAKEMGSPCPTFFHLWAQYKSMIFLPVVAFIMAGLATTVAPFFVAWITVHGIKQVLEVSAFFGACTIPISLFLLPYWFLKQTSNPSFFQRLIRNQYANMRLARRIVLPYKEQVAFFWYLSHPGQAWPKGIETWGNYIDTNSFDWQDPKKWEEILLQAQQKTGKISSNHIPVLTIGSEAQEMAERLESQPVNVITPLFQAILERNSEMLQQLLPSNEINRPYAQNGNTPLHVAALNGYTEIVALLLAQPGIDKTRTNNDGKTALDLAQEKGFKEIAGLLENK